MTQEQSSTLSKACKRCGEVKPLEAFSLQRLGKFGRMSRCRPCRSAEYKEYKAANPERTKALALARAKRYQAKYPERVRASARAVRARDPEKARIRDRIKYAETKAILDAARTGPCVDCGIQHPPECMDLDHVRGEKKFGMSVPYVKGRRLESIMAEIAKCDLRCPSCHRLRHHNERTAAAVIRATGNLEAA